MMLLTTTYFKFRIRTALLLAFILLVSLSSQAQKYVSPGGGGALDGSTWADAMDTAKFRTSVRDAVPGDVYWIQAGTYTPDQARDSSFRIPLGVKLYGGFSATDTTWASRNWRKNETILSGDVGTAGDSTDNNYHVVLTYHTDTSTMLDGFTIMLGRADGAGLNRDAGGGILNDGSSSGNSSSMTVSHCVFKRNYASTQGGAFCDLGINDGGVASAIYDCIFYGNKSASGAAVTLTATGGSSSGYCNSNVYNCLFVENVSTTRGGGVYSRAVVGTTNIVNCTFYQNSSPNGGFGGNGSSVYARSGTTNIRNCITSNSAGTDMTKDPQGVWTLDHTLAEGNYGGATNTIVGNPFFLDSMNYLGADNMWGTADDGLNVKMGSLAINSGKNGFVVTDFSEDMVGTPRIQAKTVDLGAYESSYGCPQITVSTPYTTACAGSTFNFTARTTYAEGPVSKNFGWRINGVTVGNDDSTFTSTSILEGDSVYCYLISTQDCSYPKNVVSNKLRIHIEIPGAATISGNTCSGNSVSVTAPYNTSLVTWYKNSNVVGYATTEGFDYGVNAAGDSTGISGADSTKLNSPRGMVRDAGGNLYIADRNNAKILMWPFGGSTYGMTVAGDKNGGVGNDSNMLNIPVGVFMDGSRNLYIADSGANRIHKWALYGTSGETVAGSTTGTAGSDSTSLSGPTGVYVNEAGTVYVADFNNNRVQKLTAGASYGITVAGSAAGTSGSDSTTLNGPAGVWVNQAGDIYVSDYRNNRVQKWAAGATYGTTVAGNAGGTAGKDSMHLDGPADIRLDRNGILYITDQNNHRVVKMVNEIGYLVEVAGSGLQGNDSASLSHPWGVAVDEYSGDVFVSDMDNNRIQHWTQVLADSIWKTNSGGDYSADVLTTGGCPISTGTLTVNASPSTTINASGTTILCSGASVDLHCTTPLAGYIYQWYNKGSAINGATTDSITTSDSGVYTLLVTDGSGCSALATNSITVAQDSTPSIAITAAGSTTICQGDSVKLSAASFSAGNSLQWYFNSLGTAINGATSSDLYANSGGTYYLEVTSANGCTNNASTTVTTINAPAANITATGSTTFCQGDSVKLDAGSVAGNTYQWWMNGNAINGATNSVLYASAAGDYKIQVTNSNNCSSVSQATTVTVNALPSASITANGNTTFCEGDSVALDASQVAGQIYQWYMNGNTINGATNSTYYALSSGTYTVMVTSSASCSATTAVGTSVTVNPVPAASISTTGNTTFCQGDSVKLSGTTGSGYTYQWMNNGNNIAGATGANYYATAAGDYTVMITATGNCSATSSAVSVTVNAGPTATVTPSTAQSFCNGDSLILTAGSGNGYTYQWYKTLNPINGATNISYTIKAAGTYFVSVTSNGCKAQSSSVTVTVNSLPSAPVISAAGSVLTSTAATSYQWYKDGVAITGATSQSYTATTSGKYKVEITDANGCKNTSAQFTYNGINDPTDWVNMNLFPNPTNGLFSLNIEGLKGQAQIIIYDLAGREVMRKIYTDTATFDMSAHPAGIYLVKVTGEHGASVVKLVKE